MEKIDHEAFVPFPAKKLFDLVNDIEKYPEFLPWCSAAKVLSRNESEVIATLTVHKGGVHKSFTTKNSLTPYSGIEMTLVEGPLKHLHGIWQFIEENNDTTLVKLSLSFDFDSTMLRILLAPVFHQMASTLLKAFVDRAAHATT